MKRVTMGGTDAVVTDDRVAALILEYAQVLGGAARTDAISVPSLLDGRAIDAEMLLGPASQITVTPDLTADPTALDPFRVESICTELSTRIEALTGPSLGKVPTAEESFVDFDRYDRDRP